MGVSNKKNTLCAGIVINGLSWNQLVLLNDSFKQLPQKIEVLLIKQVPYLPAVFYQVRSNHFEAQIAAEAKQDLFWAADAFDSLVMSYVFRGPRAAQVLRVLPGIDYLIGYGLKPPLGIQRAEFVGSVRAFIESYAQDDLVLTTPTCLEKTVAKPILLHEFYQPVVAPSSLETSAHHPGEKNNVFLR